MVLAGAILEPSAGASFALPPDYLASLARVSNERVLVSSCVSSM